MGVNSLPKTVTRQRRGCDLNPGPSAPESSTLTTRLPSHPSDPMKFNHPIVALHFALICFLFFSGTESTDSPDCLPILLSIPVFTF